MPILTSRPKTSQLLSHVGPLHRQVYERLQTTIRQGQLQAGQRLPSTRALAAELGVSRNTVMAAFEQLIAEGYLEGQAGSGTFVTQGFPKAPAAASPSAPGAGLSRRGGDILNAGRPRLNPDGAARPFEAGVPAIDAGLLRLWWRLIQKSWKKGPPPLGYQDPAGYLPLRRAIAVYLAVARGVRCEPEQIVITSGAQQGLDLAARLLTDQGDAVWMEDPGYGGARTAFEAAGARVIPIPVDREGLVVAEGLRRMPMARLAYVTPSHQFPVGATMPLTRRLELLKWAREADAWIVEDDYDSEYRFSSRPLPALQGLDDSARVVYIGTFSKVMFPGLRLGYVVVPGNVAESFAAGRAVGDRQSPWLEQAALTEFLREGHFGRHVRRMRSDYRERAEALVDAARKKLDGRLDVRMPETGLHVTGWLREGESDVLVSQRAARAGVSAMPLSRSAILSCPPGLVLGYAGYTPEKIRLAVDGLASALRA
ncbi:MAG: PLP-dependent aminotransferase family protein [Bryobacteraceae bacterium]